MFETLFSGFSKLTHLLILLCIFSVKAEPEIDHYQVLSPPSFVKEPLREGFFVVGKTSKGEENPFRLECEASGNPRVVYTWKKNGENFNWENSKHRVFKLPDNGTLVFTSPRDEDEGHYQCFATNKFGTAISIVVYVRKIVFNIPPEPHSVEINANEGHPLSLKCNRATGFPEPHAIWATLVNGSISFDWKDSHRNYIIDPLGDLHFSTFRREDLVPGGYYVCYSSDGFNDVITSKISINFIKPEVAGKLEIPPIEQYVSSSEIVAFLGDPLTIYCIFGGIQHPKVLWKRNDFQFSYDDDWKNQYGMVLNIPKVSRSDEATYECMAHNYHGVEKRYFKVTVKDKPVWNSKPKEVITHSNENVKLLCDAAITDDMQVEWFVNGVPLKESKPNPRRKLLSPTKILINNVEKTDIAVYQCNVSNNNGYIFGNLYLNVLDDRAQIINGPDIFYESIIDGNITIRCEVFGSPKPKVTWRHNKKELLGKRFKILANGDLEISSILFKDKGQYQCFVANEFGEAMSNPEHGNLLVKEKTTLIFLPVSIEFDIEEEVVLHGQAISDPSLDLTIEWEINGQTHHTLHTKADYTQVTRVNSELIMKKPNNTKTVYFIARTRLDEVKAKAMLHVYGTKVPVEPKIKHFKCEDGLAEIKWKPQDDPFEKIAPTLIYTIQTCTSSTLNEWKDTVSWIPGHEKEHWVRLTPWETHSFRLIAENRYGESTPAVIHETCTTSKDVPYKNPENVVAKGTNPNNLVISWKPMHRIEHHAPGFFYRIYYRRYGGDSTWLPPVDIQNASQSHYEVKNLETYKPYIVKIEAHNSKGQAKVSAGEILGYTGGDKINVAPKNLSVVKVIDSHTVKLQWEPIAISDFNGEAKGYKIQISYLPDNPKIFDEVTTPYSVTRVKVDVSHWSKMKIWVRAYNGDFDGPPSNIVFVETPEGVPEGISHFKLLPWGSTAFSVLWRKPHKINGILTGYKLYWKTVKGTEIGPTEGPKIILDQLATSTKLAGLKTDTEYRVTIKAMTDAGEGYAVSKEYFTHAYTGSTDPEAVFFTWESFSTKDGKAEVRIKTLPNFEGHPGDSGFFVQYKKKGTEELIKTEIENTEDYIIIKDVEFDTEYEVSVVAVREGSLIESNFKEIHTVPTDEKKST